MIESCCLRTCGVARQWKSVRPSATSRARGRGTLPGSPRLCRDARLRIDPIGIEFRGRPGTPAAARSRAGAHDIVRPRALPPLNLKQRLRAATLARVGPGCRDRLAQSIAGRHRRALGSPFRPTCCFEERTGSRREPLATIRPLFRRSIVPSAARTRYPEWGVSRGRRRRSASGPPWESDAPDGWPGGSRRRPSRSARTPDTTYPGSRNAEPAMRCGPPRPVRRFVRRDPGLARELGVCGWRCRRSRGDGDRRPVSGLITIEDLPP